MTRNSSHRWEYKSHNLATTTYSCFCVIFDSLRCSAEDHDSGCQKASKLLSRKQFITYFRTWPATITWPATKFNIRQFKSKRHQNRKKSKEKNYSTFLGQVSLLCPGVLQIPQALWAFLVGSEVPSI